MNTLYGKTLIIFISGFLFLITAMAVLFLSGYDYALKSWVRDKEREAYEFAESYLLQKSDAPREPLLPEEAQFIILDKNKEVIYTSRGPGFTLRVLREEPDSFKELSRGDEILGYYYLGRLKFADDSANNHFLDVMFIVLIVDIFLGLVIAGAFSFFFSRGLSAPARSLAKGLDTIASGSWDTIIPEKGPRELSLIAQSANRLSRQLIREKTLRDQWARDVAHDLRTPIASLQAQLEAMSDGVLEMTPGRIRKNLEELSRVKTLIDDLDTLMKLEQPEITIHLTPIQPEAFVESITSRFEQPLLKKKIQMNKECAVSTFIGDRDLLVRAVSNLLSNALRHTPEKGTITFGIKYISSNIEIQICNTGEPIDPGIRDKIFTRLFRGEYARKSPGSGLGLSITQQIITLHKGRIRVVNHPELGTCFSIILPQ